MDLITFGPVMVVQIVFNIGFRRISRSAEHRKNVTTVILYRAFTAEKLGCGWFRVDSTKVNAKAQKVRWP